MADFFLRAATAADDHQIRALIRRAQINPTGLDWHRFVLAGPKDGEIWGCGQVKPHGQNARELASIAVWERFRGQGIASAIIRELLRQNPGTLYLMCRSPLGPFYERFGFREIHQNEMPAYFRRISRLAALLAGLSRSDDRLMVMIRD